MWYYMTCVLSYLTHCIKYHAKTSPLNTIPPSNITFLCLLCNLLPGKIFTKMDGVFRMSCLLRLPSGTHLYQNSMSQTSNMSIFKSESKWCFAINGQPAYFVWGMCQHCYKVSFISYLPPLPENDSATLVISLSFPVYIICLFCQLGSPHHNQTYIKFTEGVLHSIFMGISMLASAHSTLSHSMQSIKMCYTSRSWILVLCIYTSHIGFSKINKTSGDKNLGVWTY